MLQWRATALHGLDIKPTIVVQAPKKTALLNIQGIILQLYCTVPTCALFFWKEGKPKCTGDGKHRIHFVQPKTTKNVTMQDTLAQHKGKKVRKTKQAVWLCGWMKCMDIENNDKNTTTTKFYSSLPKHKSHGTENKEKNTTTKHHDIHDHL